MTIGEIYEKYGMCTTLSILAVYNGKLQVSNMDYQSQLKFIKRRKNIEICVPENVFEYVSLCNRMVKHNTCPANLKNRFYHWKHKFVKQCVRTGLVKNIYKSDNYLRFVIDYQGIVYEYHQFESNFKYINYEISGEEEYIPVEHSQEFVYEDYQKAMYGMIVFCNDGAYLKKDK